MKVCIAENHRHEKSHPFWAPIPNTTAILKAMVSGNVHFGHLCTLKEPNDYKPHWKVDLNNLPMLPEKFETKVVENSGIQKQFKIKKLFDKAELVINCGDAGQEGELIQRWVMNEAQ
jgi:DNA topoisomerase IA